MREGRSGPRARCARALGAVRDEIGEAAEGDWAHLEERALARRALAPGGDRGARPGHASFVHRSGGALPLLERRPRSHGARADRAGRLVRTTRGARRCGCWAQGRGARRRAAVSTSASGTPTSGWRSGPRSSCCRSRPPVATARWPNVGALVGGTDRPLPVDAVAIRAYACRGVAVWVAQATGRPVVPPADDLTDAFIAMSNPHFLAAAETVVRAWLDAGRTDPATIVAKRSAEFAAESDATPLMRTSAALLDAWTTGSAESARTAATWRATSGRRGGSCAPFVSWMIRGPPSSNAPSGSADLRLARTGTYQPLSGRSVPERAPNGHAGPI